MAWGIGGAAPDVHLTPRHVPHGIADLVRTAPGPRFPLNFNIALSCRCNSVFANVGRVAQMVHVAGRFPRPKKQCLNGG